MSTSYVDQRVTLESCGQTINYVKAGDGPLVTLLLPGALGTIRSDMSTLLDGLNSSGRLTLVAWDPPGYGASRPPERTWPLNYFERDADHAVEFMRQIGHDRFSAVGWSDGGITGLVAASRHPAAVERLAVWGANAHVTDKDMEMLDKVADVAQWSERMRAPMEAVYGKEGFPKLWAEFNRGFREIKTELGGKFCDLDRIRCPTLVIHGNKDAMVDPVHPEHLRANIKGARLHRFPDGKHNLHLKYKEEFNKMVEEFLLE